MPMFIDFRAAIRHFDTHIIAIDIDILRAITLILMLFHISYAFISSFAAPCRLRRAMLFA